MNSKYRTWLENAPIKKKFFPTRIFATFMILIIGLISVISVSSVNNLSQQVFTENVKNTELLNNIVTTMYACRVLGRDILLEADLDKSRELYDDYLAEFESLDSQMDNFLVRLDGAKATEFSSIIIEKDKYKASMIESADVHLEGGDFDVALEALTRVTPIANQFFDSIDKFLNAEKALMEEVLYRNEEIVYMVLALVIISIIVAGLFLLAFLNSFAKSMSKNLVELEAAVNSISKGNLKSPIPEHLFTKDEVGHIAVVVDQMKSTLLEYTFKDTLTGGYNSNAYHEDIYEFFSDSEKNKNQSFWCIIFDMNNLKTINDKYGHIEGDFAIKTAYARINELFSPYGKTYRVGGDEFVSLLTDTVSCTDELISSNLATLAEEIKNFNERAVYEFSIAWSYGRFEGITKQEFETFFSKVDKEMYKNKNKLKASLTNK